MATEKKPVPEPEPRPAPPHPVSASRPGRLRARSRSQVARVPDPEALLGSAGVPAYRVALALRWGADGSDVLRAFPGLAREDIALARRLDREQPGAMDEALARHGLEPPPPAGQPRRGGRWAGRVAIPEDFDALPPDVADAFGVDPA